MGHALIEAGAQFFERVERQGGTQGFGSGTDDGPIFARIPRREGGAACDLHAAFSVHIGAGFFRVSCTRQDDISAVCASITVGALIDDKGIAEFG